MRKIFIFFTNYFNNLIQELKSKSCFTEKQLQKDKRALLRQLRSLQRNIREYDQTILNRIIENKNIKLEEYKDKNLKR